MIRRVQRAGAGLLVALTLSALGWPVQAADPVDAKSAYERARYYGGVTGAALDLDQAFRYTRIAAEAGHLQAQVDLGFLYHDGNARVPKDLAASFMWFRKAAASGSTKAACMLGDFYRDGTGGVKQDFVEANTWYRRTAMADDACAPRSQYELYAAYEAGRGVRKDLKTATQWLVKAAESGNPRAQRMLGRAYETGQGVPRDLTLAKRWRLKSREGVAPHDDEHEHDERARQANGAHSHDHHVTNAGVKPRP